MGTEPTMQAIALEAYSSFTRKERDDKAYYLLEDDSPAKGYLDMHAVHAALDDRLPDDWVYDITHSVCEACTQYDNPEDAIHEIADGLVDIYTGNLLKWAGDHMGNLSLCNATLSDFGPVESMEQAAQAGQYMAIQAIAMEVLEQLQAELNERMEAWEDKRGESA